MTLRKPLREEFRAKPGLEILFATREPGDGLDDLRASALVKELRERYWVRQVKDVRDRKNPWAVSIGGVRWIERQDLGKDRNHGRCLPLRVPPGGGRRGEPS